MSGIQSTSPPCPRCPQSVWTLTVTAALCPLSSRTDMWTARPQVCLLLFCFGNLKSRAYHWVPISCSVYIPAATGTNQWSICQFLEEKQELRLSLWLEMTLLPWMDKAMEAKDTYSKDSLLDSWGGIVFSASVFSPVKWEPNSPPHQSPLRVRRRSFLISNVQFKYKFISGWT